MGAPERKLRSTGPNGRKNALFCFDDVSALLFREAPMRTSHHTNYDDLHSHFADSALPEPTQHLGSSRVTAVDDFLPRKRSKTDVLPDALYEPFHRRMTREEKAMTASDRAKVLTDMEFLQALLLLLNQKDWAIHLPKITVINDPRDPAELHLKLRLTKAEIARLLAKYDSWKRRCDLLARDMREYAEGVDSDDENADVFLLPPLVLAARRERQRAVKNGPVVRIKLNNGFEIILDPCGIPKIVPEGTYTLPETDFDLEIPVKEEEPVENGKVYRSETSSGIQVAHERSQRSLTSRKSSHRANKESYGIRKRFK